jgi:hypothetical protein
MTQTLADADRQTSLPSDVFRDQDDPWYFPYDELLPSAVPETPANSPSGSRSMGDGRTSINPREVVKGPAEVTPTQQPTPPSSRSGNNGSSATTTTPVTTPSSPSTTPITRGAKKALGGVLPANVDPHVACEEIRRAALGRSAAEAKEMEKRRRMLLNHENGALDRETEWMQVNLRRWREMTMKRERRTKKRREKRRSRNLPGLR